MPSGFSFALQRFFGGLLRALLGLACLAASGCVGVATVLTDDQAPDDWLNPASWIAWLIGNPPRAGLMVLTALGVGASLWLSIFQVFYSKAAKRSADRIARLIAEGEARLTGIVTGEAADTRSHIDARFTQLEILIASGPTREAEERVGGDQIETQRQEIEALRVSLAEAERMGESTRAELAALAEDLSTARARFIDDLSKRDSAYRAEIAVIRDAVEDIASTPEGRAALRQFNAGEEIEALHVLDQLRSARDQARQHRADLESAAEARRIAVLAREANLRGKGSVEAVRNRFRSLIALDPDNHWDWVELCGLERACGRLREARAAAEEASRTAADDRDRGVAWSIAGDVAVAEGDLPAARRAYEDGRAIFRVLADGDPKNTDWQRDLSVIFNKLGDVAAAEGDLPTARKAYEDSLKIRKALADRDPKNTDLQRGLSVSFDKLGDVAAAEGDLPASRKAYEDSLKIRKALADEDPKNTDLQRDLSVSFNKLGDVATAEGDLPAARKAYEDDLAIAKALADRDPKNAAWQRDLSVSFNKLGDVALREGELPAARKAYEDSLLIITALADRDPKNADWRRDLSLSYERLGDEARQRGDLPAARKTYEEGLKIRTTLADRDPKNFEWALDVAISFAKLGQIAEASGDPPAACAAFREAQRRFADAAILSPSHAEARRMAELAQRHADRVCGA